MALTAGTRIGSYEITVQIGVGGMGEVYRATDTKLKREVAIKVLPASVADDPERLSRFQREAEVLASLNHPNIAAIHGLEESGGVKALVMELVEGPTLADRIAQGAIATDEALPIAKQIAEALEAAHEQGIIHRDLKPANIKVRPDGTVKVLDFGLAKAMEPAGAAVPANASQLPTITTPAMTQAGIILGTAAYMSPEQARGKPVDRRTDIWAFGCVLYEMLTGRRAFVGDDVTDTIIAVASKAPEWATLPPLAPAVDVLLRRCLDKDPKRRLRDVGEARLALEGAFESPAVSVTEATRATRPGLRQALPYAAAGALVASLVSGVVVWSLRPTEEPRAVSRFEHVVPLQRESDDLFRSISVSRDGRHFVYRTNEGMFVRSRGELDARLIPGTEGTVFEPFLSPDGESVGYVVPGALRRIAITGGVPLTIWQASDTDATNFHGASWAEDGTVLIAGKGIARVSANGGTPELVIPAMDNEQMGSAQLLPDGESVLFSVTTAQAAGTARWDQAQVVVQSLRTGERTVLLEGGSDARYVPTGHLLYARGNDLFAVAFDLDRLTIRGGPVPVVQGVQRAVSTPSVSSDAANYGVSDQGTLVYLAAGSLEGGGGIFTRRRLMWVNRGGGEEPLDAPARPYSFPRVSPDGTQVVVDVRDEASDVWVWHVARETLTRLTFDPGQERFPVWSPDGRRIAFSSQQDGSRGNLHWQPADGTGQAELVADGGGSEVFPTSFTPDGTMVLVYGEPRNAAKDDIGVVSLDGGADRGVAPLLNAAFNERNAEVSPDGRWLAYESDESGQSEVYVRPFPDLDGGRWQVSPGGGSQPAWARSGRELFYRTGNAMMGVRVEAGERFVVGNPEELFRGDYAPSLSGRNYDVSPDGQRFLMLKVGDSADSASVPPLRFVIVENFFEELKRLVPVD